MENTKTPEQLIAELQAENASLKSKLQATENELTDALASAEELQARLDTAEEKASANEPPSFEHEGVTYEVIIPRVSIPGIGERTALEVAADKEAQAYLVRVGTEGSVIQRKE